MSNLTPREREVMRLLLAGRKPGEIGAELCISRNTVKTHLRQMRDKAGARTTIELAAQVVREGE